MPSTTGNLPLSRSGSRFVQSENTTLALILVALVASIPAQAQKVTKSQQEAERSYPEAVEEARRNSPPTGAAGLYVLRPSKIVGIAGCFYLEIDRKTWGGLGNGQYTWDILPAGEHSLKRTVNGAVSLKAEPGKTYYVVISPGGFATGGVKIVSPEEGEKIKSSLSLNPDRWLLRQYLANWPSVQVGMTLDQVQHLIHMSEGHSSFEDGVELKEIPGTGWAAIGGTGKKINFTSMLGYRLTFVNGILTEKHDDQSAGLDSRGCPAPVLIR